MQTILETIIILIAGTIQGLTTFGFSMITLPFLTKLLPIKECVPLIIILNTISNFMILIGNFKNIQIKKLIFLIASSFIFVPVGVYLLEYLNAEYLTLLMSVIMIIFSILLLLDKTFKIKKERVGYIIAGGLSGFLCGSISISGPPIIIFLSNQGLNKTEFRGNLSFYFLLLNIWALITFFSNKLLFQISYNRLGYYIPALLIGSYIGIKLSKKVNDKLFKKIILVLLLITGLWTYVNILSELLNYDYI